MPTVPAVDAARLESSLLGPGRLLTSVRCLAETGSTNADLAAAALDGAPGGLLLTAEHQAQGRGRFTRPWRDTPGASVAMSLLLRPEGPIERWSWLPLVTGLAIAEGLRRVSGLPVVLKWPNDVLIESGPRPGKLCGILAERVETPTGAACVIGLGINVALDVDELPVPTASSLLLSGAAVDKSDVVIAVVGAFERWYARWVDGEDLRVAYAAACASIGRRVRVQLDAELGRGSVASGVAEGVDETGSLVVRFDDGEVTALSAGDVVHLR